MVKFADYLSIRPTEGDPLCPGLHIFPISFKNTPLDTKDKDYASTYFFLPTGNIFL